MIFSLSICSVANMHVQLETEIGLVYDIHNCRLFLDERLRVLSEVRGVPQDNKVRIKNLSMHCGCDTTTLRYKSDPAHDSPKIFPRVEWIHRRWEWWWFTRGREAGSCSNRRFSDTFRWQPFEWVSRPTPVKVNLSTMTWITSHVLVPWLLGSFFAPLLTKLAELIWCRAVRHLSVRRDSSVHHPSINFFSNRIGSITFFPIFPIFGLHVHNNIAPKPVELEFWFIVCNFFYRFSITKYRWKLGFFEVFGHILKKFLAATKQL